MKIKKLNIPIYQCEVTIILDKDLSYVTNKYKTIDLSNYGAVTMRVPNTHSKYIIAFEYTEGSIIAHEIVHLVNYIFEDKNIILDTKNDETQAYLTGWLFREINKILN
jgi:hypothetical protein